MHVGAAVAGMLSSTGHCHAFDAAADGYCRDEGIGLVALELLASASRRDETASTVTLTACSVRHNGQSATFAALNSASQKRLLDACVSADPARLGCVEVHGTGTRLGDPIELAGLAAFVQRKKSTSDCALRVAGVKGLVGHAEPAAGGAGLLAVLAAAFTVEASANARLRTCNPVTALHRQTALVLPVGDAQPVPQSEPAGSLQFRLRGGLVFQMQFESRIRNRVSGLISY